MMKVIRQWQAIVFVLALAASASASAQDTHPTFSVTVTGRGPEMILIPGLLSLAELSSTDLREQVASITSPVLLIAALGSIPEPMRPTAEQAYRAQVARIPGARVKIAMTRHFIMLDDPAFLFAAMDEVLAALPRR
jgi:pimeloyl-ACP methyl ester carboxylesterase